MIKYDNDSDEMIFDVPKTNIMVIDVDCQGLLNLSPAGERLKKEYPEVYKKYMLSCLIMGGEHGNVLTIEDKGRVFALMFTTLCRIGISKDDADTVKTYTIKCLDKLKKQFPSGIFSSGILNRHTSTWISVSKLIDHSGMNWIVHRN